MSVVLKELVHAHNSTETRSAGVQTEPEQRPLDLSKISLVSRSKRPKRRKNHGLVPTEFQKIKPKKGKEVANVNAQNLENMSRNISSICSKLDDFQRDHTADESKSIVAQVGAVMNQLNNCVSEIRQEIKQINRSYDDWMNDLQNSENGRRLMKKLQKTVARVIKDEKSKLQHDCRKKLEREKSKLAKHYRLKTNKHHEAEVEDFVHPIVKEMSEILQSNCQKIREMEEQDKLFLKSLDLEFKASQRPKLPPSSGSIHVKDVQQGNLKPIDLNRCRKLLSESSSDSNPAESDENN